MADWASRLYLLYLVEPRSENRRVRLDYDIRIS